MKKSKGKKKKVRTISQRGCRAKGHSFERWVAEQLRKVFPDSRRHLEYQMGEALGRDVANVGEYLIQCKRNRKYANPSKINEIQIDPIDGGVPVLITKGDHMEPLACLPFSDFLRLVSFHESRRKKGA